MVRFFGVILGFIFSVQTIALAAGSVGCYSKGTRIYEDHARFIKMLQERLGGEVLVSGNVIKILPDDTNGLKHQKYVINVDGHQVLVATNTQLAPHLPLHEGDPIVLCGEFLPVGPFRALIHWTHYDPAHRHEDGWTFFNGRVYGTRPKLR